MLKSPLRPGRVYEEGETTEHDGGFVKEVVIGPAGSETDIFQESGTLFKVKKKTPDGTYLVTVTASGTDVTATATFTVG